MPNGEPCVPNFTISDRGKAGIEAIRQEYLRLFPDNPPVLPTITRGFILPHSHAPREFISVAFFRRSEEARLTYGIYTVSGIRLTFYVEDHILPRFEGKVLDHTSDRGFFLSDP